MPDIDRLLACGVTKAYGALHKIQHKALEEVTVEFRSGKRVGIIGESGSGKSTLVRLMLGLSLPTEGRVSFNGRDLGKVLANRENRVAFRRSVQFIGQDTTSSFDPLRTLRDAVRAPLLSLYGLTRAAADDRIDMVLTRLALPIGLANHYPQEVSGGQRQRFAIARAIVVEPRILVCDEVVSALDVSVQGAILNLLKAHAEETGAGLAFVTHNLPAAGFIADELIVMQCGKVVESGSTEDVIRRPRHEFTARLVESCATRPVIATANKPCLA